MKLSRFGKKFTSHAGIISLMDDLGNALAKGDNMIMMGGGNPGSIPEVETVVQARMKQIAEDAQLVRRVTGIYDPPQGELEFIEHLVNYLNARYDWGLTDKNIALTNGSQSAFFILFNMFAGEHEDGSTKRIMFPLAPEYIGYADSGLSDDFFVTNKPSIELIDDYLFKYHVDFESLDIDQNVAAICVSRPTNPTGNVLTDNEITHLDNLAKQHNIPLIIDGAYGTPFPQLIFSSAQPIWNQNTIFCLSLSKLGLPAARTGIVIANEQVVRAVSSVNAIINLATGSFGSMLGSELIRTGQIDQLCADHVKPFYQGKAERAVKQLAQELNGYSFRIHKPEGAMFLWLWLEGLSISSRSLYERLKKRGVLVVSGDYFFPGLADPSWPHQYECLRITYSQDEDMVSRGLSIIADEVKKVFDTVT
ncbi:MAG: valine--pyruvate transaminase [Gammaproteobacteria bacterium]|nr:MAG: valine--pyruvate transaminase [Gammaproteobacteria bacterium]